MATSTKPQELPQYLLNPWRLQFDDERHTNIRKQLSGWKVSSLAEAYLEYQLDRCDSDVRAQELARISIPTLSSLTAGRILEMLRVSNRLELDVQTIGKSLNSTTLNQIVNDPRTPYHVLRAFHTLPQPFASNIRSRSTRRVVDIDEAVLTNERYIRSRGEDNRDGKYLVTLKELSHILLPRLVPSIDTTSLDFVREDPPKGGYEFVDEFRKRIMRIQSNDDSFVREFETITGGILKSLDWSNVLVTGNVVFTALMDDVPLEFGHGYETFDLEVHLYGLSPEEANRKVEEIYDVWGNNLPTMNCEKVVVKGPESISFITNRHHRSIKIVLELLPSATQVLMSVGLDACALGFDGSHVLMLPRCARALETGYSTFTMDIIWGQTLGNRQATSEDRIFRCAECGFGLRILPSYAKLLEEDTLEEKTLKSRQRKNQGVGLAEDSPAVDAVKVNETAETQAQFACSTPKQVDQDWKPHGSNEPGLKTLKRVAYLGQDYVHRFCFGATPLTVCPKDLRLIEEDKMEDESGEEAQMNNGLPWNNAEEWKADLLRVIHENDEPKEANDRGKANKIYGERRFIRAVDLNPKNLGDRLPCGSKSMDNFELFMRHCEAWRLRTCTDTTLHKIEDIEALLSESLEDSDELQSEDNVTNGYRDDLQSKTDPIDAFNDVLFNDLKRGICDRLGIALRMSGYRNYLTRRIRYRLSGPDLASVQEKQITFPLVIPWELENYLLNRISQQHSDLLIDATGSGYDLPLIAVHDPAKHDPLTATLPSLQDTVAESGNIRYWVITNERMWLGQHRASDIITRVLWSLFYVPLESGVDSHGMDNSRCISEFARSLKCKIILPELSGHDRTLDTSRSGLPCLRESLLFRRWALHLPILANRNVMTHRRSEDSESYIEDTDDSDDEITSQEVYTNAHRLFDENAVLYPFPDHLFWEEGDEGEWDKEGAPEWKEAVNTAIEIPKRKLENIDEQVDHTGSFKRRRMR